VDRLSKLAFGAVSTGTDRKVDDVDNKPSRLKGHLDEGEREREQKQPCKHTPSHILISAQPYCSQFPTLLVPIYCSRYGTQVAGPAQNNFKNRYRNFRDIIFFNFFNKRMFGNICKRHMLNAIFRKFKYSAPECQTCY
jgi:hypothetical protein